MINCGSRYSREESQLIRSIKAPGIVKDGRKPRSTCLLSANLKSSKQEEVA